jgi:AcrR family transcriptional regulator
VSEPHGQDVSLLHVFASVNPVSSDVTVRRRPVQARSRERFDQVLAAAAALIGERGVGDLTITDIAVEAGMALTAVYRYFPNKQAVLRELALQTFARDTDTLLSGQVPAGADAEQLIASCIEEFWRRHAAEPYRLQLRAAIHADPELSALDLAESRANARTIATALAGATGAPTSRCWSARRSSSSSSSTAS